MTGDKCTVSRSIVIDNMEDADIDNSDDNILTLYVRNVSMSMV